MYYHFIVYYPQRFHLPPVWDPALGSKVVCEQCELLSVKSVLFDARSLMLVFSVFGEFKLYFQLQVAL